MNNNVISRKIIMLKAGLSETAAARSLGVKPQAVHNEIAGVRASRRVREGLCELTKTTPEEFWPEFYPQKEDAVIQ